MTAVFQAWRQAAFLHWRVEAHDIAALLPTGLVPDVIDGSAWITLTPFTIASARVGGIPVPIGRPSPETNLRTYVRDRTGRDGLWLIAIDVPSAAYAGAGRTIGAPYRPAAVSVTELDEGRVHYAGTRGASSYDFTVELGDAIEPDETSARLTGQWRAYTRLGPLTLETRVRHQPWPLRAATVVDLRQTALSAAGLPEPAGPPLVHYSPGVDAHLAIPRPRFR